MKAKALKLFEVKGSLESLEKQRALWEAFSMDYEEERRRQGRRMRRRAKRKRPRRSGKGLPEALHNPCKVNLAPQ